MTKYPWAQVGRKVVCIGKGPWMGAPSSINGVHPKYNEILTIREIVFSDLYPHLIDVPLLRFVEGHISRRSAYSIQSFKPLTDISVFKEMLKEVELV